MIETLLKYPGKCTCSYPEFLAINPAPKRADLSYQLCGPFCIHCICVGTSVWENNSSSSTEMCCEHTPLLASASSMTIYIVLSTTFAESKHGLRTRADSTCSWP